MDSTDMQVPVKVLKTLSERVKIKVVHLGVKNFAETKFFIQSYAKIFKFFVPKRTLLSGKKMHRKKMNNSDIDEEEVVAKKLLLQKMLKRTKYLKHNRSYKHDKSVIILKMATVENDQSLQQKINYKVSKIGKNVKIYSKSSQYMNVNLDECGKGFFLLFY